MKLLIIAGPYEADRIRKAAVSAGFETVAVEPGESLSGWITASRPELIVMAPQMVHPDPATALVKVRLVPRGRVPIFLVGDAADEGRMANLAEGFFVRPVSPEALLDHARAILSKGSEGSGPRRPRTAEGLAPPPETTLMGLGTEAVPEPARSSGSGKSGPHGGRPAAGLKPLVSTPASKPQPIGGARAGGDPALLLAELGAGIDAILDAELGLALAATPRPRALDGQNLRVRLLSQYALVEEGDYFEVLGLRRDATGDDVRRARDRLIRELAPESTGRIARELGPEIDAIRKVVEEAARVLGNDRLRARYAAALLRPAG
jgi:hypothetical protein